jgi:hypothetical protein
MTTIKSIFLHRPNTAPIACHLNYPGALFVTVGTTKCCGCQLDCPPEAGCAKLACPTMPTCPNCGAKPWRVRCDNCRESEDDRHLEGEAKCCGCGAFVGLLRVEIATLFGLREDRAVCEEIERAGGRVF